MDTIKKVLESRAVLVALWAFIRALISAFFPSIPQPILASADALVAVVIATVVVTDARGKVNDANARKLNDPE